MINSSRCAVLVALLWLACVSICRADLAERLEEDEARLMQKYGKLLARNGEPESAEEKELLARYHQLSEELEARLPNSNDVEENIAAASELDNEDLAKAKASFALLGQLSGNWEENKQLCSSYSEKILRLNMNLAVEMNDGTRVGGLIRKVAENHAHACQGIYATKYHQKLEQLDEKERDTLYGVFPDDIVAGWMARDASFLVDIMHGNDPAADLDSDWQKGLARRVFVVLKLEAATNDALHFVLADKSGKTWLDPAKFQLAYDQLLRQPCSRFVQLQADVFEPASFDLSVSRAPLVKGELSKEEIQLAFGFFRYETCKMVMGDKQNAFETAVKKAINN